MKSMLIVDDEQEICEYLEIFFSNSGTFKVFTASSGNEAIEIYNNNNIDVVLSDICMPNGDGTSLIKKVDLNKTIFYFMSGFSELSEPDAIKLGAQTIVQKPFNVQNLVAKITSHFV